MNKQYVVIYKNTLTSVFGMTMFPLTFEKAEELWEGLKLEPEYKPIRILKVD
jgi:hypothetical protein